MSSFWQLSSGESANDGSTTYEAAGGNEPIPKGTSVLANVEDVGWREYEGTESVNIKWRVLKPEAYANRVIFHRLYLTDDKPGHDNPQKKRDNDRKTFGVIDTNAGGKLSKKSSKPTDDQMLFALTNKQMVLTLDTWEMNGKSGNWIRKVSEKTAPITAAPAKPAPARQSRRGFDDDLDENIPF